MNNHCFYTKFLCFLILLSFMLQACSPPQEDSPVVSESETPSDSAEREMLLIGTFHYNNPGADVVKTKTFDILSSSAQEELDVMSGKIYDMGPQQVFVEWPYDEQAELDSLYTMYRAGTYFDQPDLSDFYRKNEIFQLAFRVADSLGLERVHAIDYLETEFPFDSVMQVIQESGQTHLMTEIQAIIEQFTVGFDEQIASGIGLMELTAYINRPDFLETSNRFHNRLLLTAGDKDNLIGPYLSAQWYERNLFMWSLMQKRLGEKDDRLVVLLGASHAAMFQEFAADDPSIAVIELDKLLSRTKVD